MGHASVADGLATFQATKSTTVAEMVLSPTATGFTMSNRRSGSSSLVLGAAALVGLACGGGGGGGGGSSGSGQVTPTLVDYVSALKSSDGTIAATLNPGAPPAAAAAAGGSPTFLRGGTSPVPVDGTASRVIVAVADVDGYWELSGLTPGVLQTVLVTFGQGSADTFRLRIGTGDATTINAYQELLVTLIDVGTGAVQVNVTWDLDVDLDLHVLDPKGEEIYFDHRHSASGGILDLDSNVSCKLDHVKAENITWPSGGAPAGTYKVLVNYFEACTVGTVNYVVTVNVSGHEPQTFTRSFTEADADRGANCFPSSGDTMLCGTFIASFTAP
jgi:hypothetical protein